MSIVKIQSVNRLDNTINYLMQDNKTDPTLISTYDCDVNFLLEDFNEMYEERKFRLSKETNNKARMIIQSFDDRDNITEEEAHEIGKKLADNYLEGNHKYIIVTHIDTDNIHNHIVFNEVRNDNYLMFNTTRKNTIDRLRLENDKLSEEYNLIIYDNKTKTNKPYISQKEIEVRKKGKSFKEEIENVIDKAVDQVDSYEEFIKVMEDLGYKSKEGKHLAFLNEKSDRFMRTRTLGMNYTRNSLKYRIENKNFKIHKFNYTIKNKRIDTTEKKFRENKGLRMWASRKNINYLLEISDLVINKGIPLEEIKEIQKTEEEFLKNIEKTLEEKDNMLHELNKMESAFQDYEDSAPLIAEYKRSKDKRKFKRENYQGFKKFDMAKRDMYLLKKNYGIKYSAELILLKEDLTEERNKIYLAANKILKNREKEKLKDMKQKNRKIERGRRL